MGKFPEEKHSIGQSTHQRIVRADQCPPLSQIGVAMVGVTDAASTYSISRRSLDRTYLLACIGGEGRVWSNGRWERCGISESYVSRAGFPTAYQSVTKSHWHFAWVIFNSTPEWLQSLSDTDRRVLPCRQAHALYSAIEGIYREINSSSHSDLCTLWAELILAYCEQISKPSQRIHRFQSLWERVDSSLAHPWTLDELARQAGFSKEHFRRECLRETGRSPIRKLTQLRMQRAKTLLKSTRLKVSAIADLVGYSNAFAFSSAYKKWEGSAPSLHSQL
jgi:AraC-like DNA-binding protein